MGAVSPGLDNTLGVILAGGQGRRMGGVDKALVTLGNQPLGAHVAGRLAAQLAPGRLYLGASWPPERDGGLGLPRIYDDQATRLGPLAGLLAAMRVSEALGQGIGWVLSAPTDTPFLPDDLLQRLSAGARDADIVLAASAGGLCQVCGLWAVGLTSDLAAALASGQNKVLTFVEAHCWARVEFPLEPIGGTMVDPFFNINTPEDLALACEFLGGARK